MDCKAVFQKLKQLWEQEEYEKAKTLLEEALQQAGEEKDYQSYLSVGCELLTLYQYLSDAKAFDIAEDLLLLMEEMQMEGSQQFAAVLTNTAALYREAGKKKPAYQYYLQALRIYEELFPVGHEIFLSLYVEMSRLLSEMDERDHALTLMNQAKEQLHSESGKPVTLPRKNELLNLAFLFTQLEKAEEAGQLFALLLDCYEETQEKKDLYYMVALSGQGEACFQTGDYQRSADAYEKAAVQMKAQYGETAEYAELLKNLSAVYEQLHKTEQSGFYKEEAARIMEKESHACKHMF